jgi:hypothetical protein
MIKGIGGAVDRRGAQGAGRYWRRKREMAAVVVTRGIVATSKFYVLAHLLNQIQYYFTIWV